MVGLEAVPARLVEQDPTAAALDHDRHDAGRRRAGGELGERPPCSLARGVLDVVAVEQLEADGRAERLVARLHAGVARGDAHHGKARPDLVVAGQQAV